MIGYNLRSALLFAWNRMDGLPVSHIPGNCTLPKYRPVLDRSGMNVFFVSISKTGFNYNFLLLIKITYICWAIV